MNGSDSLAVEGLRVGYGASVVLDGVDLELPEGRLTALIGPNGSGKSTLLRSLAGLLKPLNGDVTLGGRAISSFRRKDLARRLSFLPQNPIAPEGLLVEDLLRQGRYPHQTPFSRWSTHDDAALGNALALTHLEALRDRPLGALSGGQRQRAWIAMALAQQADIMLLDEPTSFLDIAHQLEILDLLRDLARRREKTVILVLHDLNHAARYADHLVCMQNGAVVAAGKPADLLTPDLIKTVFGVRARTLFDPHDDTPHIALG